MIKIGLVGVGFMGMIHYLASLKLQGGKVVAICSRDQKKLAGDWRSIQGNFGPRGEMMDLAGIKKYADLDSMLADKDIDLIDICNPTYLHRDTALKALRAGKHVLVEKPLALEADDADVLGRGGAKGGPIAYGCACAAVLSGVRLCCPGHTGGPIWQVSGRPLQTGDLEAGLVE